MNRLASFDRYRSLVFAIAYRMLGSVTEAEDIVQEAYSTQPLDTDASFTGGSSQWSVGNYKYCR